MSQNEGAKERTFGLSSGRSEVLLMALVSLRFFIASHFLERDFECPPDHPPSILRVTAWSILFHGIVTRKGDGQVQSAARPT